MPRINLVKKNALEKMRLKYRPHLPSILSDLSRLSFEKVDTRSTLADIQALFPHVTQEAIVSAIKSPSVPSDPLRVGVVFSGGQAAGGHNVIAGLFEALMRLNSKNVLISFLDGPAGIIQGKHKEITQEIVDVYRNLGGFDLLGSGRAKIETEEQLKKTLEVMLDLKLDGLVIIGGDDSNTNAAFLAEYFLKSGCKTRVIGVPKTIDGDLTNDYVAISFGFDTATKTYAHLIGNLAKDALSDKKYYHFVKLMGRSASHIALECALLTQPNLTLIGEEALSLQQIISSLADLVIKRAAVGKQYGLVLIPEGLIEFIPEIKSLIQELSSKGVEGLSSSSRIIWSSFPETIQKQFLLARDAHGNLNVSAIQTDIFLIDMLKEELKKRHFQAPFNPVPHFFGYEGRSAFPSNFDVTYAETLGYVAALLIKRGYTGYMSCVFPLTDPSKDWKIGGISLTSQMHFEMRQGKQKPVIAKTLVNLKGKAYLTYKAEKEAWALEDRYVFPGPIQFFGEPQLTDTTPLSI